MQRDKTRCSTLRGLYPEVLRRGPGAGLQLAACPARGLRSVHQKPAGRRVEANQDGLRRWRPFRRDHGAPALQRLLQDIRHGLIDVVVVYKVDRLTRSLADFAKMVEVFDAPRRLVRGGHPAVQHHHVDGPSDAQRPAVVRAVRTRGHGRTDPGQDRGLEAQRYVDGRVSAARVRRPRSPSCRQSGRSLHRKADLPALSGSRFCPAAEEGSRPGRGRFKDSRLEERNQIGRPEFFARRAVRTAVQSDLHRRDSPQAGAASWTA